MVCWKYPHCCWCWLWPRVPVTDCTCSSEEVLSGSTSNSSAKLRCGCALPLLDMRHTLPLCFFGSFWNCCGAVLAAGDERVRGEGGIIAGSLRGGTATLGTTTLFRLMRSIGTI